MSSAQNNPVNKPAKEFHTADVKVGQRGSVNLDLPRESESIEPIDHEVNGKHVEIMMFMEEPVTIAISKSSEKNAAIFVDCWVNGKGAEVFMNGRWTSYPGGILPVNMPLITKRKYVEVLARAKQENIETEEITPQEYKDPVAHRFNSGKYPITVIKDTPQGHAWLSRILMEN